MNNELELKILETAQRIKDARESLGISVEHIADMMKMSKEEYLEFENGEKDFTFTFIYKFAQICNIDITDLMEGDSPSLSVYTVTRKGEGLPIFRREGYNYNRLAARFKNKLSEPFHVVVPYDAEALNPPYHYVSHEGQEINIVIKGCLKIMLDNKSEILYEGDCIYFDSATPHCEIALGGTDVEFYSIVINPDSNGPSECVEHYATVSQTNTDLANIPDAVYKNYVETETDENGVLSGVKFKNTEKFNFAFDVVDAVARTKPDKLAMLWVSKNKEERRFTFGDMSRLSNQTANYFESLGIKKGDKVMLVLKRHYQFWLSILALHKIGAIVIPATHQLVEHDFEYRFKAADVKAIVCTVDDNTPDHVDGGAEGTNLQLKIAVGDNFEREGWHNFKEEVGKFSEKYERTEDSACGDDTMLMFFTSGTTGYPKIAMHNFKYPLGHFVTAKYWHNVDPNGLHFTISDTGWGKALWGKLYGQWLCEAPTFTYDFDRFDAKDLLPLIAKYKITTFCAPPTMYRFFIKEDLKKYDLRSIKYATVAGEALNPEVYHQFLAATGIRLMEGFGQTETTLSIGNFVGMTTYTGAMGKPSPVYDVDILDPDGNPCKVGETGEICIHTEDGAPVGLFKGYYNDPEATARVWHDGLYHTGDTAFKEENGYYKYVGRVDDVIKSSGYRIGPFEIESVIMELPYVLECAVVAAPDPVRGQVVKAVIVLTKGSEPSEALKKEIQAYVKHNTAPYKYPRIVEFVTDLPKTISGKIIRAQLR